MTTHNDIELRTAHDVRHMRVCLGCKGLGDDRKMIGAGHISPLAWWHGRCYIKRFGMAKFLALPKAATNTLTLGDIGGKAMYQLLDRRQK